MAEIIERKKKDGTFSYMIRVYSGRTRDDKVITKGWHLFLYDSRV